MKEDMLPEGWEETTIEKVGKVITGKTPSTKDKSNFDGKIPFVKPNDLDKNGFIYTTTQTLSEKGAKCVATLPKNSLMVTCIGNLGKVGITTANITATNQQINSIIPFESVDYKYLYFQLLTLKDWLETESSATTISIINKSKFSKAPIILPDYKEQQYLSQKLTALLDEVAQTKQRLEAIPALLKQFRQSVLADAVSGRLTEIAPKMIRMSDIAKFQNGFAFNSEDFSKSGEWQVFRLGNIRDGFLFYENKPVFISEKLAKTQEKFIPKVGDSLISMTGTRFKQDYGFACIVEKDEKILVNQRVGRIIPIKDKIIPKFLNLSLRSEHFRQQFFKGETGGVNQGNVGSKHIMSISINLPTLEQQTKIVQKVETYFALADEIETQVNAALENVNLLTQSILAKAFSGELSAAWRTQQAVKN